MTSVVVNTDVDQPPVNDDLSDLSLTPPQSTMQSKVEIEGKVCGHHEGTCAICFDKKNLQDTALVKGCEHAYCVICILRWATYSQNPTCPQCKHPFEFLDVHRCLNEECEETYNDFEDYYAYEDEEDELDDVYFSSSATLRLGNQRRGDNGYVRAGRQEARPRPACRLNSQGSGSGTGSPYESKKKEVVVAAANSGAGSSREPKKEVAGNGTGRRAKRALKHEAADRAAAAKHQEHLVRLGLTGN